MRSASRLPGALYGYRNAMEIVIVVLLVVILAALAFAWTKFRPGAAGGRRLTARGEGLRGRRGAAVAARHDPMAEAVERHAMATDPHEAAEAELRLQAQANRVAADLHAQQASALESELHGNGNGHIARRGAPPAYGTGAPVDEDGRPIYRDGEPPYEDDRRAT